MDFFQVVHSLIGKTINKQSQYNYDCYVSLKKTLILPPGVPFDLFPIKMRWPTSE